MVNCCFYILFHVRIKQMWEHDKWALEAHVGGLCNLFPDFALCLLAVASYLVYDNESGQ